LKRGRGFFSPDLYPLLSPAKLLIGTPSAVTVTKRRRRKKKLSLGIDAHLLELEKVEGQLHPCRLKGTGALLNLGHHEILPCAANKIQSQVFKTDLFVLTGISLTLYEPPNLKKLMAFVRAYLAGHEPDLPGADGKSLNIASEDLPGRPSFKMGFGGFQTILDQTTITPSSTRLKPVSGS